MVEQLATEALELFPSSRHHNAYDQLFRFVNRHIHTVHPEQRSVQESEKVKIAARCRSSGGFGVMRVESTPFSVQLRRSAAEIARDNHDHVYLRIQLSGTAEVDQLGRSHRLEEQSCTLLTASEPALHSASGAGESLSFIMPRAFVDQRLTHCEDMCVRPVPAGEGLLNLVLATVSGFERTACQLSDAEFRSAAKMVGELVILGFSNATDMPCGETSVRAATLLKAKRVIRRRLADPELTLTSVAGEVGVSLNYLHKLFHGDGITMWEYLKHERLLRARQRLDEIGPARSATVKEIAYACGFSDPASFSTAFKRAFGLSPSELRR